GQSMTVAFAARERGAAFIASAIFWALVSLACAIARSADPGETNASTRRDRARCIRSSRKGVSADNDGHGIARRRVSRCRRFLHAHVVNEPTYCSARDWPAPLRRAQTVPPSAANPNQ